MNAKKKGNAGENAFANWMQSRGVKAYKNASSGANQWKSDIHNDWGLNIEVKTVKRLNLLDAWRQSARDASMAKTEPTLAIRFDGMPENEWLMVIHSEDWLHHMKQARNASETTPPVAQETPHDRSLKYDIQRLVEASKKVLRGIDKEG